MLQYSSGFTVAAIPCPEFSITSFSFLQEAELYIVSSILNGTKSSTSPCINRIGVLDFFTCSTLDASLNEYFASLLQLLFAAYNIGNAGSLNFRFS